MPRTVDYKKLAEKLQKELDSLKGELAVAFQQGFETAHIEIDKMETAYEKYMKKAEAVFFKEYTKKIKGAVKKSNKRKKL